MNDVSFNSKGRLSDPIPREDGFMVCYMIREIPKNAYWEDGRQVSAYSLRVGDTTIHDLKREPLALNLRHMCLLLVSRALRGPHQF
jgi:hypothetical protein